MLVVEAKLRHTGRLLEAVSTTEDISPSVKLDDMYMLVGRTIIEALNFQRLPSRWSHLHSWTYSKALNTSEYGASSFIKRRKFILVFCSLVVLNPDANTLKNSLLPFLLCVSVCLFFKFCVRMLMFDWRRSLVLLFSCAWSAETSKWWGEWRQEVPSLFSAVFYFSPNSLSLVKV